MCRHNCYNKYRPLPTTIHLRIHFTHLAISIPYLKFSSVFYRFPFRTVATQKFKHISVTATNQYYLPILSTMAKPGLLYTDYREHVKNLVKDLIIFFCKSIFYILESIFLTIIPDRFRKMKVIIDKCIRVLKQWKVWLINQIVTLTIISWCYYWPI